MQFHWLSLSRYGGCEPGRFIETKSHGPGWLLQSEICGYDDSIEFLKIELAFAQPRRPAISVGKNGWNKILHIELNEFALVGGEFVFAGVQKPDSRIFIERAMITVEVDPELLMKIVAEIYFSAYGEESQ